MSISEQRKASRYREWREFWAVPVAMFHQIFYQLTPTIGARIPNSESLHDFLIKRLRLFSEIGKLFESNLLKSQGNSLTHTRKVDLYQK